MWVPADPVLALVLEGWGPEGQHSADAAQTFVVALRASLWTVEMMRWEIRDWRLRADGSVIIIGFDLCWGKVHYSCGQAAVFLACRLLYGGYQHH